VFFCAAFNMPKDGGDTSVIRLAPYFYIHVLDVTTNITRLVQGPMTYIKQDNEKIVEGPTRMLTVPPRHYVTIRNPVLRDEKGEIVTVQVGECQQIKLRHAEDEIRLSQDPFPLYPGEELKDGVTQLTVVVPNQALKLRASLDCQDHNGVKRVAGDEWLFVGPGTYIPTVGVDVLQTLEAIVINPSQALRLRAEKELTDSTGTVRVTGEEWLVETSGAYLPGVYERTVAVVNSYIITDKSALRLRAIRTFTDKYGKTRRNGEEWLITTEQTEAHIPGVYEEVLGVVDLTVLTNRQYAVVHDPWNAQGVQMLGAQKLVKGPDSFFLRPGESIPEGIQDFHILGDDEGLILRAVEAFDDASGGAAIRRTPGDRWMIKGPCEYVPPVTVEVVETRKAIPLDDNEGVYVRDTQSGKVRAVIGQTYMLTENEELWKKELPPTVEALLKRAGSDVKGPHITKSRGSQIEGPPRDKSMVITFRVPHNGAVQIYDYKQKKSRVIFGPDMVMLGPDEQFTQLSLSGGKPKKPNEIQSLCLLMGPDFCTDIIQIETADHARLQLQLSYNWRFDVDQSKPEEAVRIFSVSDFVGDMCKACASRIRGAVAGVQFDDFHKNSAKIIRSSVFGLTADGKVKDVFKFPENGLVITSVDIQAAEPVDQRTRDALQKSVQLAIEITTDSQEAAAKHKAANIEQEARGRLERQKIKDEADAEEQRKKLIGLQAESAAVESTGQAKAEAQSRAEADRIKGEAAVEQAKLRAEAARIEAESELLRLREAREAEIAYMKEQDELAIAKQKRLAEIETTKFASMVSAIGPEALVAMANAGPEGQAKLLAGLGIQSTLITDGKSPINLFQTAQGLVGGAIQGAPAPQ
jgi:major vault protein